MINKDDFKEFIDIVYELENLGADVIFKYLSNVNMFDVTVYNKGYDYSQKPDFKMKTSEWKLVSIKTINKALHEHYRKYENDFYFKNK